MKKAFFAILVIVALFKIGFVANPFADTPAFVESYGDKVVLYATSWCGYCQKTRELLQSHGIEYIEFDVEKSSKGASEFKQLGGRGVPVLLIGGEVIKGYNPDAVLRLAKEK